MVDMFMYVSIFQLCAWDGCGTPTGYAKHMHRYHSNGKSSTLEEEPEEEEAEEEEAAHHQIVIIQLFIILLLY